MLRRMDQPPPIIAVKGEANVFALPAIAIVGARNASLAGIKFARNLAAELGREGYAIVSGLARGIDTAAHQGSLATGTVAVLAGGLDQPYPPENIELCEEIAGRGGAAISEMPFGWEPRARDFPRRNRLIAGLSLGLVVVEAAKRSGSLISARLAGEMGRLVFAVPGSPLDPRAAGSNRLLKDGAILVTEASDVLDQIAPIAGMQPGERPVLEEPPDFSATPPPGDARSRRRARSARPDAGRRRRDHPPHRPARRAGLHDPARARPRRPAGAPRRRHGVAELRRPLNRITPDALLCLRLEHGPCADAVALS